MYDCSSSLFAWNYDYHVSIVVVQHASCVVRIILTVYMRYLELDGKRRKLKRKAVEQQEEDALMMAGYSYGVRNTPGTRYLVPGYHT